MSNIFVLSWDCTGLESCINITAIEKQIVWETLQSNTKPSRRDEVSVLIDRLVLRAKYNSQRHYEIYSITVEDGIEEEDIVEMFQNDPQYSADLVRQRGNKIYSDRLDKTNVKIV